MKICGALVLLLVVPINSHVLKASETISFASINVDFESECSMTQEMHACALDQLDQAHLKELWLKLNVMIAISTSHRAQYTLSQHNTVSASGKLGQNLTCKGSYEVDLVARPEVLESFDTKIWENRHEIAKVIDIGECRDSKVSYPNPFADNALVKQCGVQDMLNRFMESKKTKIETCLQVMTTAFRDGYTLEESKFQALWHQGWHLSVFQVEELIKLRPISESFNKCRYHTIISLKDAKRLMERAGFMNRVTEDYKHIYISSTLQYIYIDVERKKIVARTRGQVMFILDDNERIEGIYKPLNDHSNGKC